MVEAVLFGADGVLVDTCELHFRELNRALESKGWRISREDHEAVFRWLPTVRKLEKLTEELGFPKEWHHEILELKQQGTLEAIDREITPDAKKRELLIELRAHGFGIGVCSNAFQETLERMLEKANLAELCSSVIGSDRVRCGKPSPECYMRAAWDLNVTIDRCAIVETSPIGLQAAFWANPLKVFEVQSPAEVGPELLPKLLDYSAFRVA